MGSAAQWIEIPDLSKRHLALSSLHVGGHVVSGAKPSDAPQAQFSVDHKFQRSARIDLLAFVYNATRVSGGVDALSAHVRVLREGREVAPAQAVKIAPSATEDAARIPITGAVSLGELPAGQYEIEVTVNDNISKTNATQRTPFEIQ